MLSVKKKYMGIFELFKSKSYQDPVLGILQRVRGRWTGLITIPATDAVPLLLSGGRAGPEEANILLAREFPERYSELRDDIQIHLFEHYKPYQEAFGRGEIVESAEPFTKIGTPSGVWPHTKIEHILIEPLSGVTTIEIAYRVTWDEEHTLGARIRDWRVFEFCGSV